MLGEWVGAVRCRVVALTGDCDYRDLGGALASSDMLHAEGAGEGIRTSVVFRDSEHLRASAMGEGAATKAVRALKAAHIGCLLVRESGGSHGSGCGVLLRAWW